jgi:ABC-type nitrate/sulfonate/bicarbonate transport system ATPase subunit
MSEDAEKTAAVAAAEGGNKPATAPASKGEAAKPEKTVSLPPIVEFKHVSKTYDDGFTAIKDVTFCIDDLPDKMEFTTILGPSGSGKSTILRLIAGLAPQHPPTTGDVLVQGRTVLGPGPDRGMVFQDYTSFDNRTVEDNVAFGLECRGVPTKDRREQARDWIGKVGLDVDRDSLKYPHQLSGGMRQRVAIARSLILKPKIMLMDEPFGALDPRTRLNMQDLLVSLTREAQATVFFVTHSIEEAVYLGDRTFIVSSAPGTILKQIPVPPPDFPARVMQQQPKFMEIVFEIRDIMETLESSTRAGDE